MANPCPECRYSPGIGALHIPAHTARFDHLLGTNECPSDVEELSLRTFARNGQTELEHLDNRIVSVTTLLEGLKTAKEKLNFAVGEHKRILSTMRSMPSELLREIFLYGAGFDKDAEEYFREASHCLELNSAPWVYGRVCRRWKDISVHTPLLWTRVKIQIEQIVSKRYFPTPKRVFFHQLPFGLSLLSLYLGRSNALPLTVYLDLNWSTFSTRSSSTSNCDYGVSTMVFSHSRRWESLFLPNGQGIKATTFSADSFPLLENLHTCYQSSPIDIPAPGLRSWSTVGSPNPSSSVTLLPTTLCGQITDYSSSGTSYREVLRTVQLLPNLCRLAVGDLTEKSLPDVLENPVSLLRLKQLVIKEENSVSIFTGALLDSLSCPALISLSVTGPALLNSTIQRFEERSGFSLQYLDIAGNTYILDGLRNTTSLEALKVRGLGGRNVSSVFGTTYGSFDNNILSLLSATTESMAVASAQGVSNSHLLSIPFPILQNLELHFCEDTPLLKDLDIMEALFTCVQLRLSGVGYSDSAPASAGEEDESEESKRAKKRRRVDVASGITPTRVVIVAPDVHAMKMLVHPRLNEFRLMGLTVEILAL